MQQQSENGFLKWKTFQIFGSKMGAEVAVLLPLLTILLFANPSHGLKCHQCNSSTSTLEAIYDLILELIEKFKTFEFLFLKN